MDTDTLKTIGLIAMILVGAASVFLPPVLVGLLALIATYNGTPLAEMLSLWAGLAGLSALLGGWIIAQGVAGLRRRPSSPLFIARPWLWVALLAVALVLSAAALDSPTVGGIAQVLGALLPGIALLSFASQRLARADSPPTWRQVTAQVSTTLTVSFGWSLFGEILALVGLAFIVGVAVGFFPDGVRAMEQLREQFSAPSAIARGEMLQHPGVLAFLLVLMAGFVPPIEEIGKLLAVGVLALARRPSRAQALAWGLTCGITFSIYEAAFANPFPGVGAVILVLRVGAMLVHGTAATLTAWGLWEWLARRKPGRLALGMALAIALHSVWNVLAISTAVFQTATDSVRLIALMAVPFGMLSIGAGVVLARALEPLQLVHVLHIERGEDR